MPGKRRGILGFIGRASRHRRTSKEVPEPAGIVHPIQSDVERNSSIEDEPEPDTASSYSEEEPFFNPEEEPALEPNGSGYSGPSINAKPTTATLAETFSSGGQDQAYEAHGTQDEDPSYTEFHNGTKEEDELYSLDYTAAEDEDPVFDDSPAWEETSIGYETCEKTLNTNLEGVNYVAEHMPGYSIHHHQTYMSNDPTAHTRLTGGTGFSQLSGHRQDEDYYGEEGGSEEQYQEYPEEYAEQGYYDEQGEFVAPYYEGAPHFDTRDDDYGTIANSTLASEHLDYDQQPQVRIAGYPEEYESAPVDSYESEDSDESWEDDREQSILDGGREDTFDDEEDEESSSDDDDASSRRRRRRKPSAVLNLLNEMKHCSLKGSSVSYDDDESADYVPDMAQVSTGASSMTSMTDSFESRGSSSYRRKQTKGGRHSKPRQSRRQGDRNLENLFNQVSAIGHELLGPDERSRRRRGKKSRRRRDEDPATKIVDSLRDIFSCGNPRHY